MLTYEKRATYCQNPTAIKLLQLMSQKQTNLAASLDVTTKHELLELVDLLGPYVCVIKTHIDILEDFDSDTVTQLMHMANQHNFIIFEDRKFADIGNTVRLQYEKGIYQIANWAAITNAHTVSGPLIIEGLKKVGLSRGNALLLLAQMSSQGSLAKGDYTQETIKMALENKDFVIGFIAQKKLVADPAFIHMTPGVQIQVKQDNLGQQYTTPRQTILEHESDVIIVGRGIYHANDPLSAAKMYQEEGWNAYLERLTKRSQELNIY